MNVNEMTAEDKKLEAALLSILDSEELDLDLADAPRLEEAEKAVQTAFPTLGPEAQAAMAKVMVCQMPSPAEIEQAEKIAQHNAEIICKREAKLAARRERQAKKTKRKKRR